jgi:hypothetical protein
MTGFKSGASDSPYDDDGDGSDETESQPERDAEPEEQRVGRERSSVDDSSRSTGAAGSGGGLPWIYRRSSVKDDRTSLQIHLQEETERKESRARSELEAMLGENVKKADLREAALLIGLESLDDVADQLREWGYDR